MGLMDMFKKEQVVVNLDEMTPEQRVVFFKKQEAEQEKMMKKVRSFVNQAIGLAEIILGDEVGKYIAKFKPYVQSFLTNPELIVDELSVSIEALCAKAGIPSHHLEMVVSKPKGYVNEAGEKVKNVDVMMKLRVYNPNFQSWQELRFDLRQYFVSIKNPNVKFDMVGAIRDIYNSKPETTILELNDTNGNNQ